MCTYACSDDIRGSACFHNDDKQTYFSCTNNIFWFLAPPQILLRPGRKTLFCGVFVVLRPVKTVYSFPLQLLLLFLSHATMFLLSSPLCVTGTRHQSVMVMRDPPSWTLKTRSKAHPWKVSFTFHCSSIHFWGLGLQKHSRIQFIVLCQTLFLSNEEA